MLAEKRHRGASRLSPDQEGSDPILESGMAQITQAMVDFDTRVVGWKVTDRYNLLSFDVNASDRSSLLDLPRELQGDSWMISRITVHSATQTLRPSAPSKPMRMQPAKYPEKLSVNLQKCCDCLCVLRCDAHLRHSGAGLEVLGMHDPVLEIGGRVGHGAG